MVVLRRIEKQNINEAKQVGTLYHVCTLGALVQYIIPNNELRASGKYWNELLKTNQQVCFTRDPLFVVPTSFNWRHKILDSLRNRYFNKRPKLSGIVEADETYFHLSFKGCRNLEKVAGRKAHKRGNSIKIRGLSKEQVCVPCAVSIRGGAFAQVGKLGTTNLSALSMTLGNRIEPKSVLCSDNLNIYREFCARHHLEHNCSGLKHVAKLLDAQGGNIQHINGYHSSMKRFMRPFNGVATKYLNNYLVWYNESRDVGYNEYTLHKNIRDGVYVEEIYAQRDYISLRPPIPMVA